MLDTQAWKDTWCEEGGVYTSAVTTVIFASVSGHCAFSYLICVLTMLLAAMFSLMFNKSVSYVLYQSVSYVLYQSVMFSLSQSCSHSVMLSLMFYK